MLITDPIADMLIRIKNAILAKKDRLVMPHSKIKEKVAAILKKYHYIEDFKMIDHQPQADLEVTLKYINKKAAITDLKIISKSGRRLYSAAKRIPRSLDGFGITIVSTNQGVMEAKEAKKKNVGGELLCQVW